MTLRLIRVVASRHTLQARVRFSVPSGPRDTTQAPIQGWRELSLDRRQSSLWTAATALSGPPRARSRRPPGHAPSLPLQGESRRWSRVPAGRERQVVEDVQAVSMYRQSVLYRQSLCTGSVDCAGSLSEPTSTRACGARPRGTATPTYSRHVSREIRKQALCAQRA